MACCCEWSTPACHSLGLWRCWILVFGFGAKWRDPDFPHTVRDDQLGPWSLMTLQIILDWRVLKSVPSWHIVDPWLQYAHSRYNTLYCLFLDALSALFIWLKCESLASVVWVVVLLTVITDDRDIARNGLLENIHCALASIVGGGIIREATACIKQSHCESCS